MTRVFPLLALVLSASLAAAQSSVNGIALSPPTIDFGDVENLTSSPPNTLTIANTGSSNLNITRISISNTADFVEFGSCPMLAPAETCDLDVHFAPTHLGSRTGSLTIDSDAVGGAVSVAFTGYGTFPATHDKIADAALLSASYSGTFTTKNAAGAPTDPDPRPPACENGNDSRNHTVWYRYQPPADGWLQVDTKGSDYDTVVSVWSGNATSLVFTACDDDEVPGFTMTSRLAVPVSMANEYFVMVSGRTANDAGILTFNSTFQTTQALQQKETISNSVNAGQSGSFSVLAQFDGSTTLSAAVAPNNTTIACTPSPGSLQFVGSGGTRFAIVNVKCTTQGPNAALIPSSSSGWRDFFVAAGCFGACLAGFGRKRSAAGVIVALILLATSCGGGAKSSNVAPPMSMPVTQSSSTPSGSYAITLVGSPRPVTSSGMTLLVK